MATDELDIARFLRRMANTSYTPPNPEEVEAKRRARLAEPSRHIGGKKHGNFTQAMEALDEALGAMARLVDHEDKRRFLESAGARTLPDTGHNRWYPVPLPAAKTRAFVGEQRERLEVVRGAIERALAPREEQE